MMYGNNGNVGSHLPSSSSSAAANNPTNPTIAYPLLHHHELQNTIMIPLHPPPSLPPFGGGGDDEFPRRDERSPQWSNQETRELIEIRAQLEWGIAAANRSMTLWEMVADRMREKGYCRSGDQCRYKWKYLVNKYKGQEASDADSVPPFFNEMHAVFTARANRLQQSQVEAETGVVKGKKRLKDVSEDQSYEGFIEEPEYEEEIEVDHQAGKERVVPKDKRQKIKENEDYLLLPVTNVNKNNGRILNGLQEVMRNFILQQQMIDMEWRESMEKRAEERERFEQEWRQKMEDLERERLMMEQAWREREAERKLREERRAEQRDALLSALLNKLIHDN